MTRRTIGIELAIRGDQVAQIFDGHPVGKPIRFRLEPASLDAFVAKGTEGMPPDATVEVLMEPTSMSWFPVAHRLTHAGVTVVRVKGQRVRALRRYLSEHVNQSRRRPRARRHAALWRARLRPRADSPSHS